MSHQRFTNLLFILQDMQMASRRGRRKTWDETVARYFNFFESHLQEKHGYRVSPKERKNLKMQF